MSMAICGKLGTSSSAVYLVKHKRKLPRVGDTISVRLSEHGSKWIEVTVDEVQKSEYFTPYIRMSMK